MVQTRTKIQEISLYLCLFLIAFAVFFFFRCLVFYGFRDVESIRLISIGSILFVLFFVVAMRMVMQFTVVAGVSGFSFSFTDVFERSSAIADRMFILID